MKPAGAPGIIRRPRRPNGGGQILLVPGRQRRSSASAASIARPVNYRLLCSAKEMVPVVRWIKTPAAIPACRRPCGLVRHLRAYATWLLGLAEDAGAHSPAGSVVHRKLMPLLQSDKIVIFLATGPALGPGFLVDVRVM